MANTHTTLTSLFSDVADNIRAVTGETDEIVADEFPSHIRNLGKPVATQWSSKYNKILAPTCSNISCAITVKAMCYYDGYWYGIGRTSAGISYRLYGTTLGNLTANVFHSSAAYLFDCIACDGTNIYLGACEGTYQNRMVLVGTIDAFKTGTPSNFSIKGALAVAGYTYTEAAYIKDNITIFFGGYTTSSGAVLASIIGTTAKLHGLSTYIPETLVSGCAYNGMAIGVTNGGYIARIRDFSTMAYGNKKLDILQGAKKVRQLGNYLCVACVKDDGTYLYYTSDDDPITGSFAGFKVTDEVLTVVDMAYAGGLYTLVGYNSAGETKVWQTADILDHGVYGQTMTLTSGYTPRVMATDGTNICVLGDNGSRVLKALATIS